VILSVLADFKRQGDDSVAFHLKHPSHPRGVDIVLMTPELGGYPRTHQTSCYALDPPTSDIETITDQIYRFASLSYPSACLRLTPLRQSS
jgi:hypothetical protein